MSRARPTAGEIAWTEKHGTEEEKEELIEDLKKSYERIHDEDTAEERIEREYKNITGKEKDVDVDYPEKKVEKGKKVEKVKKYFTGPKGGVHSAKVPKSQETILGVTAYTSKSQAQAEAERRLEETIFPSKEKTAVTRRKRLGESVERAGETEKKLEGKILEVMKAPSGTIYKMKGGGKVTKKELLKKYRNQRQKMREYQIEGLSTISELFEQKQQIEEIQEKFKEMEAKGLEYTGLKGGKYQFKESRGGEEQTKESGNISPLSQDFEEKFRRGQRRRKTIQNIMKPSSPWGQWISPSEKVAMSVELKKTHPLSPGEWPSKEWLTGEFILASTMLQTPMTSMVDLPEVVGVDVPEWYGRTREQPEMFGTAFETGRAALFDRSKLLTKEQGPKTRFYAENPEMIFPSLIGEAFTDIVLGQIITKVGGKVVKGGRKLTGFWTSKTKIPYEEISDIKQLSNKFPEIPENVKPSNWLGWVKQQSKRFQAEDYLGDVSKGRERLWHLTQEQLSRTKNMMTGEGGSYVPGLYTEYKGSTHFLELTGKGGEESLSFVQKVKNVRPPGWDLIRGRRPRVSAFDLPVEETPKKLRGTQGEEAFTAGKKWFEELAQKKESAKAYLRTFGIEKREPDLIVPEGRRFVKETEDFFTEVAGEKVQVQKWTDIGGTASKTAGRTADDISDVTKTLDEIAEESRRAARDTTPFQPTISMPGEERRPPKREQPTLEEVKREPRKKGVERPTGRVSRMRERPSPFEGATPFRRTIERGEPSDVIRAPPREVGEVSVVRETRSVEDVTAPTIGRVSEPRSPLEPTPWERFGGGGEFKTPKFDQGERQNIMKPLKDVFRPSVGGVLSGKTIKEPKKEFTGFEIRFPVKKKKTKKSDLNKLLQPSGEV